MWWPYTHKHSLCCLHIICFWEYKVFVLLLVTFLITRQVTDMLLTWKETNNCYWLESTHRSTSKIYKSSWANTLWRKRHYEPFITPKSTRRKTQRHITEDFKVKCITFNFMSYETWRLLEVLALKIGTSILRNVGNYNPNDKTWHFIKLKNVSHAAARTSISRVLSSHEPANPDALLNITKCVWLLLSSPIPKAEDRPLSAARKCLFNTFAGACRCPPPAIGRRATS